VKRSRCITIGWDIGGVSTKAARLVCRGDGIPSLRTADQYFEIWKGKERLPSVLRTLGRALGPADAMAVTITAELSDVFPTKAEGVRYVVQCVRRAFPDLPIYGLDVDGSFVDLRRPLPDPGALGATNWLATARLLGNFRPSCLLVDIGSTTTDITPILAGQVAARGRTDTERLLAGELVYTGVLRTPVSAITAALPLGGRLCPVATEYFAISADVYRILGRLKARDYSCPPPDGRSVSQVAARRRLARMVCADLESLPEREVLRMARYVYEQQRGQIIQAMRRVLRRHRGRTLPVIATGLGTFLVRDCARAVGVPVESVTEHLGRAAARHAPPVGAAYLLAQWLAEKEP
jgi:hypothetical protein